MGYGQRRSYDRNNDYNNNDYNNRSRQPKKSGAKHKSYVPNDGPNKGNNQYFTFGWRRTRYGFITYSCVSTKKSKVLDSGWMGHIAVEVVNKDTGQSTLHWGTMEKKTGKVVVDSLSIVINPRAKNGGYCGTYL